MDKVIGKKMIFEKKDNSIDLLYNDKNMAIVNIDMMHQDDTELDYDNNLCNFSHKSIVDAQSSFYNKPIIYRLNNEIVSMATDVTSHAHSDMEKQEVRIGGHIPTDSRVTFIKRNNGNTYCNVEAVIQKRYVPQLMSILKDRGGKVDVSIEINTLDDKQDPDTGIDFINKFELLGICLLGKDVQPGMEGSHLEVLNFEKDQDIKDLNRRYFEFSCNSRNSTIIEEIKNKMNFEKEGTVEHKELERQLWDMLSSKTFISHKETIHKYYIEAIYDTHIIVRDNEDDMYYKFKYDVDKDGKVKIDFTSKKQVEDDLKVFEQAQSSFSKEDIGTKAEIKVNKDEVKDTEWGSIDKAELRKKVIEAKNFKSLAKDVFLDLREGWEDGKMGALKYPVMEIVGDIAYYNRGALASAKGYAEKNKETEVLSKLKKIYEHLKLEFEAKEEKSDVMMEKKDMETRKCEDDKNCQDDVKRKDMSTDANVDASAAVEIGKNQAEQNSKLADEQNPSVANLDLQKEIDDMKPELEKLRTYKKDTEAELCELRKFKCETEEKEKEYIINETFNDTSDVLPMECKNDFIEKSKEYKLDNINEWVNSVKSKAFEFSKNKNDNINTSYTRMSVWGNQSVKSETNTDSVWSAFKK